MTPVAPDRLAARWRDRGSGSGAGVRWTIPAAAYLPIIAATAFVALVLRRPTTLTRAEFFAEDGPFYGWALERGLATVFDVYAGYLSVGQRLLTLPQLMVPPYWAPVLGNLTALLLAAGVAAFLASDRMAPLFPERWQRLAVAVVFVMLPASADMFGTLSHIQWVIGAWLLALTAARQGPAWELVLVFLVALTGPLAILYAPLFVARWWADRTSWPLLATVALGCVVQLLVMTQGGRGDMVPPDPMLFPGVIVVRTFHLPLVAALVALALVVLATSDLSGRLRLALLYAVVIVPVAAMMRTEEETWTFFYEQSGPRYFWLGTGLVVAALIRARPTRMPAIQARRALLAGFALMFVVSAHMPAPEALGWADRSACIGGPEPCEVQIRPTWGDFWVEWRP